MGKSRPVAAQCGAKLYPLPEVDRARNEVDGSARRLGSGRNLARAFDHIDARHAQYARLVVGGGCAVGRGGSEHTVLHHHDAAAALGAGSADSPVHAQPKSVLISGHKPGHGRHELIGVHRQNLAKHFGRNVCPAP